MSRWSERDDVARGDAYDARWHEMEAAGESIHGEADLVSHLLDGHVAPSVLDAGCGTGRVAIELARREMEVIGVDLDPAMLAAARAKAPELGWIEADLRRIALDRAVDLVVAAGNVMIFLAVGTEGEVIANLARHLRPGGLLVAGFQLGPARLSLDDYDARCAEVGLELRARWSTWDRAPFTPGAGADYAVSVHGLPGPVRRDGR